MQFIQSNKIALYLTIYICILLFNPLNSIKTYNKFKPVIRPTNTITTTNTNTITNTKPIANTIANENANDIEIALLFDCDGVIVETEELHRIAYNKAFDEFGLILPDGRKVEWDVLYYDKLQNTVGGGKPKMKHYFTKDVGVWPKVTNQAKTEFIDKTFDTIDEQTKLIDYLQNAKIAAYLTILQSEAKPRPGVLELMDEAINHPNVKVGICSAASKEGFVRLVDEVVGKERLSKLDIIIAGDDVTKLKPDPMIYDTAREAINKQIGKELYTDRFIVIEDSIVGLKAAKAANMKCIITYTHSTAKENFYGLGADAKLPSLNDVKLSDILDSYQAILLSDKRDNRW